MSLDQWIKKAKEDGIIKEESPSKEDVKSLNTSKSQDQPVKEVNGGSSPSRSDELAKLMAIQPLSIEQKRVIGVKMRETYGRQGRIFGRVHERFMEAFADVDRWLKNKPLGTQIQYGNHLLYFLQWSKMTPKEFGELHHNTEEIKKARDLVFTYENTVDDGKASWKKRDVTRKSCMSFYRSYTGGFKLPFDTGSGGAHTIQNKHKSRRKKFHWGDTEEAKDKAYKAIDQENNPMLVVAYQIIFKAGVRENVIGRLKPKHFIKELYDKMNPDTGQPFKIWVIQVDWDLDTKLRKAGIEYYYAFLDQEATELVKDYIQRNNIGDDDLIFKSQWDNPIKPDTLSYHFNHCLRKAGLPDDLIWTHQLRLVFRKCVTNCAQITDPDYKEFIMGHILSGSKEFYQQRDVKELAKEYVKIDFRRSVESIKEKWMLEQQKAMQKEERIRQLEAQIVEAGLPIEEREPRETWKVPSFDEVPSTPMERPQTKPLMRKLPKEEPKPDVYPKTDVPIGPPPKKCLRGLHWHEGAKTDEFCHTTCKVGSPVQYKACQELQKEHPEMFQ